MILGRAGHAPLGPRVVEDAAGVVEDLADVGAAADELVPRGVDVRDRELQGSTEPGSAEVTLVPKMIDACDPGGVSWTTRSSSVAKSASSRHPSPS